jgi:hypothetical protein
MCFRISFCALSIGLIGSTFAPTYANIQVQEAVVTPWPTPAKTVPMPDSERPVSTTQETPYQYGQNSGYKKNKNKSNRKNKNNSQQSDVVQPSLQCGFGSTCGAVPLNSNPTGIFGTGTW